MVKRHIAKEPKKKKNFAGRRFWKEKFFKASNKAH